MTWDCHDARFRGTADGAENAPSVGPGGPATAWQGCVVGPPFLMRAILTEFARRSTYCLSSSIDRRSAEIPFSESHSSTLHPIPADRPCQRPHPRHRHRAHCFTWSRKSRPSNWIRASYSSTRLPGSADTPCPAHNFRPNLNITVAFLSLQCNTYKYVFYQTPEYSQKDPVSRRPATSRASGPTCVLPKMGLTVFRVPSRSLLSQIRAFCA